MKSAKFHRIGKAISHLNAKGESVKIETFASITKAKAESRRLQMQGDGALGRGSLRVA